MMKQRLLLPALLAAFMLPLTALAQPYEITITGHINPCSPAIADGEVTITSVQGTQPSITVAVPLNENCYYNVTLEMDSPNGWFQVSASCMNGMVDMNSGQYSINNSMDSLVLDLYCGTEPLDCEGIPGGSAVPGTACDDGDPNTFNDVWNGNCQCVGVTEDCLGLIGGPDLPGSPCDDGDPETVNDTWTSICDCIGTPINFGDCEAMFQVIQAYEGDPNGTQQPIPFELWVLNTSVGEGGAQYQWNFGDGTTANEPFPSHTYAGPGPYVLCLTMYDGTGCTDTYCDTVMVDSEGLFNGMVGNGDDRNVLTINVLPNLPTSIQNTSEDSGFQVWPNPANDVVNITMENATDAMVQIIDASGRTVHQQQGITISNGPFAIPVGHLNNGIYHIRMANGTSILTERLILNR